eukprot:scaffold93476_cov54-Phaeocystis_antarctica.AAC.2
MRHPTTSGRAVRQLLLRHLGARGRGRRDGPAAAAAARAPLRGRARGLAHGLAPRLGGHPRPARKDSLSLDGQRPTGACVWYGFTLVGVGPMTHVLWCLEALLSPLPSDR